MSWVNTDRPERARRTNAACSPRESPWIFRVTLCIGAGPLPSNMAQWAGGLHILGNDMTQTPTPTGDLTLRTLAMPADANAAGDIFGGWVMAQMDLACGIRAAERARGRVVTAAVQEMAFAMPVKIGDTLCVYTEIARVGRTSMTLKVETWA
eukprot:gene58974-80763_t